MHSEYNSRHTSAFFTKRRLALGATILAVIMMFFAINSPAVVGATATKRELPIYCVQRDNKAVSLSFDAAWGNEDTQKLIDILARYNIKATFFVVGMWVDKFPESVKALSDAGHEIMNHSNNHEHFLRLSSDEIIKSITACNDKIAAVTGVVPTLFRAPFGEYDDHVIKAVSSMGMYTIQWDVDSLDWKDLTSDEIVKRVTAKVAPGSIILFHNAALNTPSALPAIIEYLIANEYTMVPVSGLILTDNYYIDHTGRQIPAR